MSEQKSPPSPGKTVHVNLRMDAATAELLDRLVGREHSTRAHIIRLAIHELARQRRLDGGHD
jgi:hypothetical protein